MALLLLDESLVTERRSVDRRAEWRTPRSLTAIIPVADIQYLALHDRLEKLNGAFRDRLRQVGDLHSFRLCALPADRASGRVVSVLFNSVHDRAPADHMRDVTERAGELLNHAFSGATDCDSPSEVAELVFKHRIHEHTVFLGSIGRTVKEIREEHDLRIAVKSFVDDGVQAGRWADATSPETIRREIRDHFLTKPSGHLRKSKDRLPRRARWLRFIDLIKAFLLYPFIGVLFVDIEVAIARIARTWVRTLTRIAYGIWWIYGLLPTAAGFLVARSLELTERDLDIEVPEEDLVRHLEEQEDLLPMNAVTILFEVRDSAIRRWVLGMILRGAELGCRHVWTEGLLSEIGTIHYARIFQVFDGRRMMFISDFDGSLNRYLDDFLGVGSRAVIPFTSNLIGCPKTRWLFKMANRDTFAPRWKKMIRHYQLRTAVWYSAYPSTTVREVLSNGALREELFAERLTADQAQRFLRRV